MEKKLYGANEATALKDASTYAPSADELKNRLTFGKGAFNEAQVVAITEKPDTDEKIRFVQETTESGNSGLIFVGNKLASSKILDIATDAEVTRTYETDNEGNSIWVETVTSPATKVTVKWFGSQFDDVAKTDIVGVHETTFDVIDASTVESMISSTQGDLQEQIDELVEDVSVLDSSVNDIEEFLNASNNIVEAEDGALTVTPKEGEGFTTYEIGVNVDASTVKVVEDKLAVATYAIDRIDDTEDDYDPGYAAQYRLMMTDPATGEAAQVGDTINIMKDFLLKGGHVCTFDYVAENGAPIDYSEGASQWGTTTSIKEGDDVVAGQLPWAKLDDGTWEEAVVGKGIKYGHTYLHLILNTNPTDEVNTKDNPGAEGNDQLTDVYLDFTEILGTVRSGDNFIKYDNGEITLNEDEVVDYVDSSLGITEHFEALDASTADQESRLEEAESTIEDLIIEDASLEAAIEELQNGDASIEERLDKIEESYIVSAELTSPKSEGEAGQLFNTLTLVDNANNEVSIDVANSSFYNELNDTIETLNSNDEYLAGLLTWSDLD